MLHCCPPFAFVIACHHATVNALVAGRFCRQLSSTAATANAAAAAGPPQPPPPPSLALSLCRSLVLSSSYHCAALSSSHCAGWLLRRLLLHCPLVILSPRCPLVILLRLVVALPPDTLPSSPLVVPLSRPFVILSLRRPLVVSSHRLVVALPLVLPPSCRPLAPLLSRHLAPAGCCINSCCATLLSSHCATPLSSHHPITALTSRRLIAPASCCIASCCTALSSSSHHAALSLSCSGWLLRCLPSCCPRVLSSWCLPLIISLSYHCGTLLLSHLTSWLLRHLSLYHLLVVLLLRRSLVVLHRLVVASTLVATPTCPHIVPPPSPLVVLSLR